MERIAQLIAKTIATAASTQRSTGAILLKENMEGNSGPG
jgi:hypothetical protein